MNYRIQELINQSWQNIEGAPRTGMEDMRRALMEELNPVMRELARLLVRECARTAFQYAPTDESACEISSAIEERFGVE